VRRLTGGRRAGRLQGGEHFSTTPLVGLQVVRNDRQDLVPVPMELPMAAVEVAQLGDEGSAEGEVAAGQAARPMAALRGAPQRGQAPTAGWAALVSLVSGVVMGVILARFGTGWNRR
jgi:hypothetical protein